MLPDFAIWSTLSVVNSRTIWDNVARTVTIKGHYHLNAGSDIVCMKGWRIWIETVQYVLDCDLEMSNLKGNIWPGCFHYSRGWSRSNLTKWRNRIWWVEDNAFYLKACDFSGRSDREKKQVKRQRDEANNWAIYLWESITVQTVTAVLISYGSGTCWFVGLAHHLIHAITFWKASPGQL